MNTASLRSRTLRRQLTASRRGDQLAAIAAVQKLHVTDVAPDLLLRFQTTSDPEIRKECLAALGHLNYRDALPVIKMAASNPREPAIVRHWAIWSIGELGTTAEEAFLVKLCNSKLEPPLGQVAGGALKKVRLDSVRVPKAAIERQLVAPKTAHPRLNKLRHRLADIGLPKGGTVPAEVVELRREMKEIDEDYFRSYMAWVRRVPDLEAALVDPKASY